MSSCSSKELAETFFEQIETKEVGNKTITTFKCQCGTKRTQDTKKGYVNLVSHIKTQHLHWQQIMNSKRNAEEKRNPFINKKANTYFSWLDWVIMDNQPFTFVEKTRTRKYSKLDDVGVDSLMKYLKLLTAEVERKVVAALPDKFGLIMDGWSEGTTHFIALFACFPNQTLLLSIAPPYDEENYDAETHKAFIIDVLNLYGKSLINVLFLVGDNAPVNTRLSDLISVPFVGCASHRFNLACKRFMQPHEASLQRINSLMGYLRNVKQAGKLRTKTDLEPVKRNVTRWSSTYAMLKRFFELKQFLNEEDEILVSFLPSARECIQLQKLLEKLEQLESVTKQLQDSKLTLSDVRSIFDVVIEEVDDSMKHYLASDAGIVHSKAFESGNAQLTKGIVKILDEKLDELSETEVTLMQSFSVEVICLSEEENASLTIAQKGMRRKRKKSSMMGELKFTNLDFIPPTSNIVERLFSSARLVLTDYRKSMSPYTFECVMFLKFNYSLWDVETVAKIVGK